MIEIRTGIVTNLSGNKEYICIGRNDTSISIYKRCEKFHTFPSFRNEIVCSAVSAKFDLAVVGARESTLFLISPLHRTITRVIDMGPFNPVLIQITKAWGFIVVYEMEIETRVHFMELFTVNGDLIRKVKLSFEIDCWSAWSATGFDYLVIAPKNGRIRVCEVFYLVFHLLSEAPGGTRAIFYSPVNEVIYINQEDGQILLIPYRVDF
jgi:hypothetical protein